MIFSKDNITALLVVIGIFIQQSLALTNKSLPTPELIDFDDDGVVGGLYRPAEANGKSRIAVYVMHAEQDYLSFSACTELPKRGFTTFCANNDASKSGYMSDLNFEDMMTDVNQGMMYLRNLSEIDQVVILGHSGGGAMMAAYQNIAENGASACQGSEKIYPCSDAMENLEAADGLILIDANYGISTMAFLSLNPAIIDESTGSKINQSLNLFNTTNGFRNNTRSKYTTEFKKNFQNGVVARNNRILKYAQHRLAEIEAGRGKYGDDEPFTIVDSLYTGFNNKFFAQDTRYLAHTTHAWPLLHKNGTTRQVVPSVRVASNFKSLATNFQDGALKTTIKRYLSTFAIRINENFAYKADGLDGIEYASSQLAPVASIRGVNVPLLTMGNTGHWEYLNAEKLHLNAGSNDSSIAFVEGAQHTLETCTACESYPGQFGNTMDTAYNYMEQWLQTEGRFV
ncbi:unnamed protein product [Penicillium salamii]|uniref:Alpha/beta hydrolase n=1 Tax=Penicillium salamii TaxID=1612424 RepID=A0A9W4K2Y4_9EURO|nr:unnamed protein product [Penicillium salamii]CAG8099706.1 unnamed protein product [Penicillium salamii]CAG8295098.1 unnamed protein product [Penicillium salamii]CAG8324296.1 unnamed protein product [Penicillium salamii]CAG8417692.1 unnamed protein product [Penicillium salamii]